MAGQRAARWAAVVEVVVLALGTVVAAAVVVVVGLAALYEVLLVSAVALKLKVAADLSFPRSLFR